MPTFLAFHACCLCTPSSLYLNSISSYPLYIVRLDTSCVFYVLLCTVVYYFIVVYALFPQSIPRNINFTEVELRSIVLLFSEK